MLHTLSALGGMQVAPHHLAAQAGRDVLRDGGNAVEAMVAAASTIAVTYPHMNAIGGDGFWLIREPGKAPIAISACGPAAELATRDFYAGASAIPSRGPESALTVAGTVSGWKRALEISADWGRALPLSRLLADAIRHARMGISVTSSQNALTKTKLQDLKHVPGFAETFLVGGNVPEVGHILCQPALADTLESLAANGLDDFYRGDVASAMCAELQRLGSPLRLADLQSYEAKIVEALSVRLNEATVYNLPPPTQGLAHLMIIGIFEQLDINNADGFDYVHGLVEATKVAFEVRDRIVSDPGRVPSEPSKFLSQSALEQYAAGIDPLAAKPWPNPGTQGDTIWMGAIDNEGRAVSFIQSLYWEFGSGVVLKDTGVTWQNRGISFSLNHSALNALEPGRLPFHTLNPSLAVFDDGRVMPYGTMGGEGQPQTQAIVFTRYAKFGHSLQQAVSGPRWLLGRTWGDNTTTLKLERRFPPDLVDELKTAGHDVEILPEPYSDTMGHAGALVYYPSGRIDGAVDPRSDGIVAGV
jgi:gamma-glutamyltranspeptidase/glutathione hydrolase